MMDRFPTPGNNDKEKPKKESLTRREMLQGAAAAASLAALPIDSAEAHHTGEYAPVTEKYMEKMVGDTSLMLLFESFKDAVPKYGVDSPEVKEILQKRDALLQELDKHLIPGLLAEYYGKPGFLENPIGLGSAKTQILKNYFDDLEKEAGKTLTSNMIRSEMRFLERRDGTIEHSDIEFSLK